MQVIFILIISSIIHLNQATERNIWLNDQIMRPGDGTAIQNEKQITIECHDEDKFLF